MGRGRSPAPAAKAPLAPIGSAAVKLDLGGLPSGLNPQVEAGRAAGEERTLFLAPPTAPPRLCSFLPSRAFTQTPRPNVLLSATDK